MAKTLFILLFLISIKIYGQCPLNIGFENGTFNNWVCYAGGPTGVITVTQTDPLTDRHTIIDNNSSLLDPYGQFPVAYPNGSKYSVKLGNDQTGSQAERVTYTFVVPAGQAYSLILNYAVVLQNPSHFRLSAAPFYS
jgi:hypothetical protein